MESVEFDRSQYIRDVQSNNGWILRSVVNTDEFYSPEVTHKMYIESDCLPFFTLGEADYRISRFIKAGYRDIGGVIMGKGASIKSGIRMHDKGELHLKNGALLGPYMLKEELVPGFRFYFRTLIKET